MGGGLQFFKDTELIFQHKTKFWGAKNKRSSTRNKEGLQPPEHPPPHSYATCLGYCAPPPLPPSCFSIPGSVSKEYMIFNSRTSKSKPCVVHTNVTSKGGGAHMSSSKHPPNSPVIKVHVLCNMNECLKMR